MMNCAEINELLSEYLDKTLDENRTDEVRRHISACVECRAELEDLRKTLNVVHALPREEPITDLWQEFAPKVAGIQAEMRLSPVRRYISSLSTAITTGWSIFSDVVRTRGLLERNQT
jgi:anti-sigma factor RsiW